MGRLDLDVISTTSPTLAETMRLCQLRAGLSKVTGISSFVLGNPKAWLGTAYHEVLEKIVERRFELEDFDSVFNRLWDQAVERQHQHCSSHPLNARFGRPETWPGYHVTRANALERARQLVEGIAKSSANRSSSRGTTPIAEIREEKFTAFDGRLVGRPDVIRAPDIIDYKSGTIIEFDEIAQAEIVKAAYVRQLRIYGFLVKENLGWWPERGLLFPSAGTGAEVPLHPRECTREATEAHEMLEEYNARLHKRVPLTGLATPSPVACKWCPFKILCTAFWNAASPTWSGLLDGAAVEGILTGAPFITHASAALAISLQIEAGSEPLRREQVGPLNPRMHPVTSSLSPGDRVRLTGLRARPDGALTPTLRTVLARVIDLPYLAISTNVP